MGQARNWTQEEYDYLQDKWGSVSLKTIAKIDYDYPNNVTGLIIDEVEAPKGTIITGYFKDLDCNRALASHTRTKETILDSLDKCRKWHTYSTNEKWKNYREKLGSWKSGRRWDNV